PLFGRSAVETSVTKEVPMLWLTAAVERAMKRQEVILRALSGALSWLQAADILGIDPRSLRRWRARYEADQMIGLYDRRQLPSPRNVKGHPNFPRSGHRK